jgi:hypothetical protein
MKKPESNHALVQSALWRVLAAIAMAAALMPGTASLTRVASAANQDRSDPLLLNQPKGVVADRSKLIVANTGDNCVLVRDASGSLAKFTRLTRPTGVALDPLRPWLFVSDTGGNRVLCGVFPNLAICASGFLKEPTGLAFDAFGNLFIADTGNHQILRRSPRGEVCRVPTTPFGLNRPTGVAVFSDVLFIVDTENNRILARRASCEPAEVDEVPINPVADTAMKQPTSLAVGVIFGRPFLFISDTGNDRVLRRSLLADGRTELFAGGGLIDGCVSGIRAIDAVLSEPHGLWFDQLAGALTICDTGHNCVRRVELNGIINTVLGP